MHSYLQTKFIKLYGCISQQQLCNHQIFKLLIKHLHIYQLLLVTSLGNPMVNQADLIPVFMRLQSSQENRHSAIKFSNYGDWESL